MPATQDLVESYTCPLGQTWEYWVLVFVEINPDARTAVLGWDLYVDAAGYAAGNDPALRLTLLVEDSDFDTYFAKSVLDDNAVDPYERAEAYTALQSAAELPNGDTVDFT